MERKEPEIVTFTLAADVGILVECDAGHPFAVKFVPYSEYDKVRSAGAELLALYEQTAEEKRKLERRLLSIKPGVFRRIWNWAKRDDVY